MENARNTKLRVLKRRILKKGYDWESAPQVFQITVLDFLYNAKGKRPAKKSLISRYSMRSADGRELSNTLNVIFIELPKSS